VAGAGERRGDGAKLAQVAGGGDEAAAGGHATGGRCQRLCSGLWSGLRRDGFGRH
jgi:hypothetical protein